jgi:molybdenum-dependent DNA-binding transcriptional regulator ModE
LRIGGGTRLEGADMKLIAEYVERAEQLEKLADGEADAVLKSALLKQAMAYRTLAHKRATQFARQPPTGSS